MMNAEYTAAMDFWLRSRLEGLHTCQPGIIESYEGHATRRAVVRVLNRVRLQTGHAVEIPPIKNVPVLFPSSADMSLVFKLRPGSGVLLFFSESSIGNFLAGDGTSTTTPEDSSRFSLTDCIAVPGLFSFGKAPALPAAALSADAALCSGGAWVAFNGGSIAMESSSGDTVTAGGGAVVLNGHLRVVQ